MENKWQVEIEWDGEDAILPLPKEVLEHLDAKEGDVLSWMDNGDGTFCLRKFQYDSDSGVEGQL